MHADKSAAVKERIRSTQEFVLQNMRSVRHKPQAKAKRCDAEEQGEG